MYRLKILFAVMALLLMAVSPVAANKVGFFAGLNLANMGGDAEELGDELAMELESELGGNWASDKTSRNGLGAGGFYAIDVSPSFAMQFELSYVQRGAKFDLTGTNLVGAPDINVEESFLLDYVEFAALGRANLGQGSSVHPMIVFGPVLGINTKSDLKTEASGGGQSAEMTEDFSEFTKSTYFGIILGAGLAFDVGETSAVFAQARYMLGLSDPFDTEDSDYSFKLQDLGFVAGFEIAVGQ